jgi:uncharacterized protein
VRVIRYLLVFIPLALLLIGAAFPAPKGFVNDFAGVLDQTSRERLEERLSAYERETSTEIAIALFPSLSGRTIEDFAVALFEEWKIGKRDNNNGILIVAAIQDRAVRIEVGYGLEGKVPDAQAGRIIREAITPRFREGKYAEGLDAAVGEVTALIGSAPLAAPPSAAPAPRGTPAGGVLYWLGLLAAAAIFGLASIATRRATQMRCPRCGTLMNLADDQIPGTVTGRTRSMAYLCPKCGYQERRLRALPSGPGWGTGGFWGGILGGGGFGRGGFGGGGFGGFGGGGSGGGGASGSW